MALSNFQYSKSWRNAEDFPTFEDNEEKVRDDMQLLFDEARDAINRLVSELKASNLPFTPTPEIDAATVQNALELLQAQLSGVILGQLPNGSVITEKLAELAVTTAKIANFAITTVKLGDASVTPVKIASGAVTVGKIAEGAVTSPKIAEGAVTADKLAEGVLDGKADLVSGRVRPEQLIRPKLSVSASRTLALTDAGKALYCTNSSAITLTVPANSAAAFPVGTELTVYRKGTGAVKFAAASGVTLYCPGMASVGSRYGSVRLKKWDSNVWSLEGEGLAPAGYLNNFSEGLAPTGELRLTEGVHYFSSASQLPSPGKAGRVFLIAAE